MYPLSRKIHHNSRTRLSYPLKLYHYCKLYHHPCNYFCRFVNISRDQKRAEQGVKREKGKPHSSGRDAFSLISTLPKLPLMKAVFPSCSRNKRMKVPQVASRLSRLGTPSNPSHSSDGAFYSEASSKYKKNYHGFIRLVFLVLAHYREHS